MANGTWTNRRTRGYQLPLAVLFVLAVALVLIGKAQSTLFDRARAHVTDWMAPELEVLHKPFDAMSGWWRDLGDAFDVHEENARLKAENARLKQWQTYAVSLEARVKRYQLLLKAVPDPALTSVLAHVIGRARRPFLQTMILDAGSANGVKPGQAVIDSRGMIGRIFLAGEHTSWVILLTDLNSRIPVVVEPGHAPAILAGDNAKAPALDTLAQGAAVHEGDQVLTSGDGGILPPGLPIGTVIADGSGFRVALLADSSATQDAEIVDFKNPVEIPKSAGAHDLPIAAAGLPPARPSPASAPGQALAPVVMPGTAQSNPGAATAAAAKPQAHAPVSAPPPSPDAGTADDQ